MRSLDLGEMRKMAVLDAGSGDRLGDIADIVVHPTDGRLLGVILESDGEHQSILSVESLRIGENAVMAAAGATMEARSSSAVLAGGVAAKDLTGANVVTEDGRLLGTISDVVVLPEHALIAYRVAGSILQKMFGGGFYIAGDLPSAMSSDGARIIVPSDTADKHAVGSVVDLLRQ